MALPVGFFDKPIIKKSKMNLFVKVFMLEIKATLIMIHQKVDKNMVKLYKIRQYLIQFVIKFIER